MKNMEREKFEESWKNAFDKAEVSPSDNVWTNIELDLEKTTGGHLKRRLMFYQMLAAASVIFAMAIGSFGLYYVNQKQNSGNNLALETPVKTEGSLSQLDESNPSKNTNPIADLSVTQNTPTSGNDHNHSTSQNPALSNSTIQSGNKKDFSKTVSEDQPKDLSGVLADVEKDEALNELPLTIDDKELPPFYKAGKIQLNIQNKKEEIDPVVAMLARLEMREKEVSGEQKNKESETNKNETLWTSIGFAAGAFNTVHSSVSNTASNYALASNAPIVDEEAKASGYSYSMGLNVGTKLSERWVFQGGVNYLTHSSDYTAHNAVVTSPNFQSFRPASTNELVKADFDNLNDKIVYTAPYNINNNLRYLSIPMQAGYLLINKSFGLQLNAGVATDLFLQNTVKADGDNLDKTTQSGGADSPYRSVNLSGLLGTELSYRFGPHYRVALNPGIRYPFNTIYKSDLGVQASPLTFDVGLRFRYIFH